MNRTGHENAVFFTAGEVELTPANGKKTLFVVGYQDTKKIEELSKEYKTPHIYFGANHSFKVTTIFSKQFAQQWNDQVTYFLDKGYMVTIDYPAFQHENVLKVFDAGVWQSRNFIPLLSVKIPNIETTSPNLTIKFDDVDFNATNRGVWCLSVKEVTDSNRFTDWKEYESDKIIGSGKKELEESMEKIDNVTKKVVKKNDEITELITGSKNNQELGLDPDSPSKLKADTENEESSEISINALRTVEDAAEIYAAGTTQDPLGKISTSKKVKLSKDNQ